VFLQEGFIILPSYLTASINIYAYQLSAGRGTFQAILAFALPQPNIGLQYQNILVRSQETGTPSSKFSESPASGLHTLSPLTSSDVAREPSGGNLHPSHMSRPLGSPSVPFTSSIDDSIVVVQTRISPVDEAHGPRRFRVPKPDSEGLIVIKKSTLRSWLQTWSKDRATSPPNVESSQVPSPEETGEESDEESNEKSDEESDVSDPQSPDGDSHRSQSVETSSGSAQSSRPPPKTIPWSMWMYETRWLRDRVAAPSVGATHGMRFATLVIIPPPPPVPSPPPQGQSARFYQSGAVGALPSMQQLWNGLERDSPAPVPVPPNPPTISTDVAQSILPSFSQLFIQQPESSSEPFLNLPAQQNMSPHVNPLRQTRIYDFNLKPYTRAANAIPYPDCLELDISSDYREVLEGMENSSEPQAHAERNLNYVMGRQKAEGKALSDRGWSVIRPENGLEWRRRPVWEDTVIPAGITYAEKICTGLPYLEITGDELSDCASLMMDGERIIGITVCNLCVCGWRG